MWNVEPFKEDFWCRLVTVVCCLMYRFWDFLWFYSLVAAALYYICRFCLLQIYVQPFWLLIFSYNSVVGVPVFTGEYLYIVFCSSNPKKKKKNLLSFLVLQYDCYYNCNIILGSCSLYLNHHKNHSVHANIGIMEVQQKNLPFDCPFQDLSLYKFTLVYIYVF